MADACPTCGAVLRPEGGPGPGLSRADNATEVCGRCSELEALLDYFAGPSWRHAVTVHWSLQAATAAMRAQLVDEPPEHMPGNMPA